MRGILIDPYTRTVTGVDTDGSLEEMYRLLGCDCVTAVQVHRDDDGTDTLWVDDEGFLKDGIPVFGLAWAAKGAQPLAGKGLVLGTDNEGGNQNASILATMIFTTPGNVVWRDQVSSGELGPSSESQDERGGFIITMGKPILREKDSE